MQKPPKNNPKPSFFAPIPAKQFIQKAAKAPLASLQQLLRRLTTAISPAQALIWFGRNGRNEFFQIMDYRRQVFRYQQPHAFVLDLPIFVCKDIPLGNHAAPRNFRMGAAEFL